MTDKQKFFQELRNRGFEVSENFFAHMTLVPHHRIKPSGDHNIISGLSIVNFSGIGTPQDKLGCVTMTFTGSERKKYHRVRNTITVAEVIKKVICPDSAQEALDVFDTWNKEAQKEMDSWEFVL